MTPTANDVFSSVEKNNEPGYPAGLGDTWEYDGVDWTNDFSSTQPTATPTQTPGEATATPTTPEETPTPTITSTPIAPTPTPKSADLDGSGQIDEEDLLLFMEQWHQSDK